jgi:death on curing protein
VARNHPFVDGHRRIAWVLSRLFLRLNAAQISFNPQEAITTVLALVAGDLSPEELADWFLTHLGRQV